MTTIAVPRPRSDNLAQRSCGRAATMLAQMRRPIIEPNPQLQLPTTVSAIKLSCRRPLRRKVGARVHSALAGV
jgi:hypothetical protein